MGPYYKKKKKFIAPDEVWEDYFKVILFLFCLNLFL